MNTKNPSRLEKQPASSIARMLVWRLGVDGSSVAFHKRTSNPLTDGTIWTDCDGNEYDTTKFSDDDFQLVLHYLRKHWERVGKFLGANG
jgi:hypothetical protein